MKRTQKIQKTQDFEEYFAQLYAEAHNILVERQSQYGSSNIEALGVAGVFSRLNDDKMNRVRKSLNGSVFKGRTILSEESLTDLQHPSTRDALIDAANYCLILIALIEGRWSSLELKERR